MMGTGYGGTSDTVIRGLIAGILCRNIRINHEDSEWRSSVRQDEAATALLSRELLPVASSSQNKKEPQSDFKITHFITCRLSFLQSGIALLWEE